MSLTFKEFLDQILETGRPVAVEFLPSPKPEDMPEGFTNIEDQESYAEPHMRAVFTGGYYQEIDDVVVLNVDYAPYDDHNRAFESSNYYDKNMQPRLTAREAGLYKPQDTFYFMGRESTETFFRSLEANPAQHLRDAWKRLTTQESYVAFLENRVLAHNPEFKAIQADSPSAPTASDEPAARKRDRGTRPG